jgi:iron complex outermembrane receptor protein
MSRSLGTRSVGLALAVALRAGGAVAQAPDSTRADSTRTKPPAGPRVHETIVVTGSRTEQLIQDAPAAMSVITSNEIEHAPADDYGDLLRNVPGLNVSQMSARDIEIVGRGSTGSLATSELVLMDSRTIYLDFFGFVMWDFLPVDMHQIKQIEVVRGPGSAVWGANALTGVVNVIGKTPREARGVDIITGAGGRSTGYGSVTLAGADDKRGYRLSYGFYSQDAYDRPTGHIPGQSTPYPTYKNQGTLQPKLDARFDYDPSPETTWSFSGGVSGTDGILQTGIGPFDIDTGTVLGYGKAEVRHRAARLGFFANVLDGDGTNVLTSGSNGRPISFAFKTQTYNVDASDTRVVGERNVFTYGANTRHNAFDLSIAPRGDNRNELGAYLQDEILVGKRLRCVLGGRFDHIDPIGSVGTPRTSLLFSLRPEHTFRVSFNRAFHAPSVVQNYLETTIVNQITLPVVGAYRFPSDTRGNVDLKQETLTAYEVGYVGTLLRRASLSLAVYRNELRDNIDFYADSYYDSTDTPPGWPFLPGFVPPNALPKSFTYRNLGSIVNTGFEVGLGVAVARGWSVFGNYSYQADPHTEDIASTTIAGVEKSSINVPPRNRANAGLSYDARWFFGSGNVNYASEAFWTDVLDSRFFGPTEAYTQVNASAGIKLPASGLTFSVVASNLFDATVQQHVFGDLIGRKIVGEMRAHF